MAANGPPAGGNPKAPAAQAPAPAGAASAGGAPAAAPQGGGGGPAGRGGGPAGRGGGMMQPNMMHGGNPYQNPAVSFPLLPLRLEPFLCR